MWRRAIAFTIIWLSAIGCSRRLEPTRGAPTTSAIAPTQPSVAEVPHEETAGVVNAFLFVATPDELSSVFTGWSKPLPLLDHFVTRTQRNPFTGQETSVRTRIPEGSPQPRSNAVAAPDLARFELRGCKGFDPLDVGGVGRALLDWDQDNARSEILGRLFTGPPDAIGVLLEVPPELTARLAKLSPNDLGPVATKWAAFFRKDAATIESVDVREALMATPDSVFVAKLTDLTTVARKAISSSRTMYLWTLS